MTKKRVKRICTKLAGCPAFSCDDDGCLAKAVKTHTPAQQERATAVFHHYEWYSSGRWRNLRLAQLAREPLCQRCLCFNMTKAGYHVDHVIPHRGNRKMFFDASNLQSLCQSCHSFKTVEEQRGVFLDYREYSHKQ